MTQKENMSLWMSALIGLQFWLDSEANVALPSHTARLLVKKLSLFYANKTDKQWFIQVQCKEKQ